TRNAFVEHDADAGAALRRGARDAGRRRDLRRCAPRSSAPRAARVAADEVGRPWRPRAVRRPRAQPDASLPPPRRGVHRRRLLKRHQRPDVHDGARRGPDVHGLRAEDLPPAVQGRWPGGVRPGARGGRRGGPGEAAHRGRQVSR
ncbi:hypothetical protein M885DRAFT_623717, partial [Pelagophyceae sp. CCMP2097]